MLDAIGVDSVQEIFDRQIPEDVRLGRGLRLPVGQTEQDVFAHLSQLAARNTSVANATDAKPRNRTGPSRSMAYSVESASVRAPLPSFLLLANTGADAKRARLSYG